MEAVIFIGVQGSGKTTFYKERFSETHKQISGDVLSTRHRQQVLIDECLADKQSFVVDNTNVFRRGRADIIARAKAAGFRVIGYYFRSELGDALRRNSGRTGKVIPRVAVVVTFKKLEPPLLSEGFDDLHLVEIQGNEFVVQEWPVPEPLG
jgi:predicted kinase